MAAQKTQKGVEKKRKSKKKKARTEVSSSSESDSDNSSPEKSRTTSNEKDVFMTDAPGSASLPSPSPPPTTATQPKSAKPTAETDEDFSAIYLRKITTELADDLDKVREAPDFKAASIPMLIHALKQGETLFSAEEKRRVVGS